MKKKQEEKKNGGCCQLSLINPCYVRKTDFRTLLACNASKIHP